MCTLTHLITAALAAAQRCDPTDPNDVCPRATSPPQIREHCLRTGILVDDEAANLLGELTESVIAQVVAPAMAELEAAQASAGPSASGLDPTGLLFSPSLLQRDCLAKRHVWLSQHALRQLSLTAEAVLDRLVAFTVTSNGGRKIGVTDIEDCLSQYGADLTQVVSKAMVA